MSQYLHGKIVGGALGSFLCPPGHPNYYHHISGPKFLISLTYAVESDDVHPEMRGRAQAILNRYKLPPINDPQVQDWIYRVMGYFRGCYVGKEGSWQASDLVIDSTRDPIKHQNEHAGVHLIRQYYPEFKLTKTILKKAYWGEKK